MGVQPALYRRHYQLFRHTKRPFPVISRQLVANYRKSIIHGQILECTNAHKEAAVKTEGMNNFIKCFQKMIDEGPTVTEGSIRGGINRMSMVHNNTSNVKGMWRDRNWMAVEIGANPREHKDFTTFTEGEQQCHDRSRIGLPL